MSAGFPLGGGAATTGYLVLYLVTFVVHLALVAAVAGGSVLVAVDVARGGDAELLRRRAARPLRDLLPLFLGLAITAGVAPLLFVQILYREAFYTANLLLFLRTLAILPALLGCFYLLYLGKGDRGRRSRAAIYGAAAALALFVAYSFSELHSLELDRGVWIDQYAAGRMVYADAGVPLRFAAFVALAAALTPLFAAWLGRLRGDEGAGAGLAGLAIAGLAAAILFAALYGRRLEGDAAAAVHAPAVLGQLGLGAAGAVGAAAAWGAMAARRRAGRGLLAAATAGSALLLWGLAVAREAVRAARLDLASLAPLHEKAAASGGAWAFAVFAVVNGVAIGWCLTRIDRARRARD